MTRIISIAVALVCALAVAGCGDGTVKKIQSWSANYQASVVAINADIAATAPIIAKSCGDLQTAAMLIAPFVPTSGKAQQYFGAANGALSGYCTTVPTDIRSTAEAVAAAVKQAQAGYNQVKAGS